MMISHTEILTSMSPDEADPFERLIEELTAIRNDMLAAPACAQKYLDSIHPSFYASAVNLLQYLAFRRHDHRQLQCELATQGLSSLGRAEAHVLRTINQVLHLLNRTESNQQLTSGVEQGLGFTDSQRLLKEHTEMLLGASTSRRNVRIMVTMPSEAANDYTLIHDLLKQGMNCMRINCAHDDESIWYKMIANLKMAEETLKSSCQIVMDLPGPKLRTGPMEPGAAVIHVRPTKDAYGKVICPARLWLTVSPVMFPAPSAADGTLPVEKNWLDSLHIGEQIIFSDTRGSKRTMVVADVTPVGCWVEVTKSAYIVPGIELHCEQTKKNNKERKTKVGQLPHLENHILLNHGDLLILTRDLKPGRSATYDSAGKLLTPAHIGCTLPEIFDDVRAGEPIYLDDGKIGGIIEMVEPTQLHIRITRIHVMGAKLCEDKGINLPDSQLRLAALTEQDLNILSFVVKYADVVEFSFANSAEDVELLQRHMASLSREHPSIVLKIETKRAFKNLPAMLLTAMRAPCCGVMIARGDLAVECGFERLAEVQEEILWICEAAHIPVIWATQVLETLAKSGMPSRAEITDAAMGHRAECVMLNKGPYVLEAMHVLDNILQRMQQHQSKKQSMLRELHIAHIFEAL